jgi:ribonuclease VapC
MMVVDTSVIAALAKAEPEAIDLAARLLRSERHLISAANWLEAAMVCERKDDAGQSADFEALLEALGLEVVPFTSAHAILAREAFKRYGKGRGTEAKLNFGDCFAYALAKALDAPLLFKGDDFSETDLKRA